MRPGTTCRRILESSELLRRTVAASAGGTYHEGGTLFQSTSDPGYVAILNWATKKGGVDPAHVPSDAGFPYFVANVQPMLVKKGCMMLGCHSPAMGHDYRLSSGSAGHFGLPTTRHNYRLTLDQIALESPDPNASRLLRKNLAPAHRGRRGSLDPARHLYIAGALCSDSAPTATRSPRTPAKSGPRHRGPVLRHSPLDRTRAAESHEGRDAVLGRRLREAPASRRQRGAAGLRDVLAGSRPSPRSGVARRGGETHGPGRHESARGLRALSRAATCGGRRSPGTRTEIAFAARGSATEPWHIYV